MTVEEYKKIWSFKKSEDGSLIITKYKGKDVAFEVPAMIGKNVVKTIGQAAFRSENDFWGNHYDFNYNIEKIILPDTIEVIEWCAFFGLEHLTELPLPKNLKTIQGSAFTGCSFTSVEFPETLETIGSAAFSQCQYLTEVTIPATVKSLDASVFSRSGLVTFNCQASFEELRDTFASCPNIANVIFPKGLKLLNGTFRESGIERIVIPEGVEEIGFYTFFSCQNLKEISLPSTLKTIHPQAFTNCNNVEKITVAENSACKLVDGILYLLEEGKALAESTVLLTAKCEGVIRIPEGVTVIQKTFVLEADILEYTIPDGITEIDACAFENCQKLEKIVIPESVKRIHGAAFKNCSALKEIVIPASVEAIGYGAFTKCTSLTKCVFQGAMPQIEPRCFKDCTSLKEVVFPSNIKSIPSKMFSHCHALEDIVIPDTVETLEEEAFSFCNSLKNVKLSKNLKKIGPAVFFKCVAIDSVQLPDGLKTIEKEAFDAIPNLASVVVPPSVKTIKKSAFMGPITIYTSLSERPKGWVWDMIWSGKVELNYQE